MPTENGVRCDDRRQLRQSLSPQGFTFDGQKPPLAVVKQNPLFSQLLFEDLVFRAKVLNDDLLLPVDPSGQDNEIELPRLQDEFHRVQLPLRENPQHRLANVVCQSAELGRRPSSQHQTAGQLTVGLNILTMRGSSPGEGRQEG